MSFELQPVLRGALVELRPLRADDFDALYAVAADPLVWEQHPAKNRHEPAAFTDFFREQLASGGALVAVDARTGHVIGMSRFHGYDEERSEVEIGWTFLARSRWGGVHNRELKRLMLRHAFRFVRSVVFLVDPQNLRSRRAVEKIGGVPAGSRPDAAGRPSVVYRLDAEAFDDLPAETMRVFLAGASGVLGIRLVPLLIAAGHEVAGMTRSPDKVPVLAALGAEPVLCDVYDADALLRAVTGFGADAVMHQLTDLPDDVSLVPAAGARNARIRREGTRNLIAAAQAAAAARFVAQSVAWTIPGDGGAAVRDLERAVLGIDGLILRYGRLYGPQTYFEETKPPPPSVDVDDAARRTVAALVGGTLGIVPIVDGGL